MSETLKAPGAVCPKCLDRYPAEYAQAGQAARWSCHACGASGLLRGDVARSTAAAAPAPAKSPPPWARNLTRGPW